MIIPNPIRSTNTTSRIVAKGDFFMKCSKGEAQDNREWIRLRSELEK
jgi:hypothetical protein